jgi:protein-tyrosine phosphatase
VEHVFTPAYNFIEEERKRTNVLVHCAAGISRCSVILISYMMKKYNLDYETCLERVRNARSICQPNSGFVKQLKEYQKSLGIAERAKTEEEIASEKAKSKWSFW